MSLKLRIKYRYRNWLGFFRNFNLPTWLTGTTTRVGLTSLVVVLSVGYVVKISALSTMGYEVHNLEQKMAAVSSDIQRLETEVASFQSMSSIQKRIKNTNLVAATKIQRLNASTDKIVAQR